MGAVLVRLLAALVLALLLAAPAGAQSDTRGRIIRDCYDDGRLDGRYTPSQLRDARQNIPDDIDEYSDCRDILARALFSTGAGAGGGGDAGGGSGGSGTGGTGGTGGSGTGGTGAGGTGAGDAGAAGAGAGSGDAGTGGAGAEAPIAPVEPVTPTPAETRELEADRERGLGELRIDGRTIDPDEAGLAAEAPRQSLPSSVIVTLALLAACAVAVSVPALRKRVLLRRQRPVAD